MLYFINLYTHTKLIKLLFLLLFFVFFVPSFFIFRYLFMMVIIQYNTKFERHISFKQIRKHTKLFYWILFIYLFLSWTNKIKLNSKKKGEYVFKWIKQTNLTYIGWRIRFFSNFLTRSNLFLLFCGYYLNHLSQWNEAFFNLK